MNTLNRTLLYQAILPFFITNFTANAMEPQQLQLEIPDNIIRYVDCSIMIPHRTNQTVSYAMKTVHTAIFEHSNLQSTIKDPIMLFHIKQNSSRNQFYVPLPAKLFIDCTDKSILQIHETDASKLFKSHPIFKKKQLQITATCKKNPNLKGNSFAEQFNNAMTDFYTNPGIPWLDKEHEHELESAEIIIATTTYSPDFIFGPRGPVLMIIKETTFKHGPNGCPNEQELIQLAIDEKIPHSAETYENKPADKNIFKSLMPRQINGFFKL